MESSAAVVQAEEAVDASVAAFMAALGESYSASGCFGEGGPAASGDGDAGVLGDDPLQRVVDAALDVLGGVARSEAKLAAAKALAAAVLAGATRAMNPPPGSPYEATAQDRSLVAEVGCALAIGDRAAGALLAEAHALTTSLPRTLAALQAGTISWAHARTMVDQAVRLDPSAAAALEAHFLDPEAPDVEAPDVEAPGAVRGCPMGEMPAYRFKAKARTWRERHHPESLEKRHAKSAADRRVEYWPDNDGMAWIAAYLPADQASAVWNRLTALSRGLQGPDEARTLTQLRADSFAAGLLNAGLLGGTGSGGNGTASPRAEVLVTVPVFSLMGLTGEPAMLDGYGPIPASMARDLVAGGANSFYRVLVDPRDGAPLEIGRTSYRVSKAMRNWLRLRDGKCPFPGCSNHSLDNEADHLLAWHNGGTTGISNLGQPCPKHHKLRHTSAWKPTPATKDEPPGWTSPTGRHYTSEHQDWEPPRWPEGHAGLRNASSAARPKSQDLYVPEYFNMPDDLEVPACFALPEEFDLVKDLDLPDFDVPEDPGPSEDELPKDPFPEWHLWLSEFVSVP
ncbi:endonuclease [Arthrobacter sp. PGP41]|uniref:HNH endonuclease signature motif containing protein n=1 Tax=Arthrobacter sp. PGP41 TaxID=2079227 RepID=UPI000CDBC486|nr:HNH endonuclease signature motif containing protein [Arthrobacter sp. PGP41]AUZ36201.1 endonuclease [Arthrobacter sp. PGP41]